MPLIESNFPESPTHGVRGFEKSRDSEGRAELFMLGQEQDLFLVGSPRASGSLVLQVKPELNEEPTTFLVGPLLLSKGEEGPGFFREKDGVPCSWVSGVVVCGEDEVTLSSPIEIPIPTVGSGTPTALDSSIIAYLESEYSEVDWGDCDWLDGVLVGNNPSIYSMDTTEVGFKAYKSYTSNLVQGQDAYSVSLPLVPAGPFRDEPTYSFEIDGASKKAQVVLSYSTIGDLSCVVKPTSRKTLGQVSALVEAPTKTVTVAPGLEGVEIPAPVLPGSINLTPPSDFYVDSGSVLLGGPTKELLVDPQKNLIEDWGDKVTYSYQVYSVPEQFDPRVTPIQELVEGASVLSRSLVTINQNSGSFVVDAQAPDRLWVRYYTRGGQVRKEITPRRYEDSASRSLFMAVLPEAPVVPGSLRLSLNGTTLQAGKDYVVYPLSGVVKFLIKAEGSRNIWEATKDGLLEASYTTSYRVDCLLERDGEGTKVWMLSDQAQVLSVEGRKSSQVTTVQLFNPRLSGVGSLRFYKVGALENSAGLDPLGAAGLAKYDDSTKQLTLEWSGYVTDRGRVTGAMVPLRYSYVSATIPYGEYLAYEPQVYKNLLVLDGVDAQGGTYGEDDIPVGAFLALTDVRGISHLREASMVSKLAIGAATELRLSKPLPEEVKALQSISVMRDLPFEGEPVASLLGAAKEGASSLTVSASPAKQKKYLTPGRLIKVNGWIYAIASVAQVEGGYTVGLTSPLQEDLSTAYQVYPASFAAYKEGDTVLALTSPASQAPLKLVEFSVDADTGAFLSVLVKDSKIHLEYERGEVKKSLTMEGDETLEDLVDFVQEISNGYYGVQAVVPTGMEELLPLVEIGSLVEVRTLTGDPVWIGQDPWYPYADDLKVQLSIPGALVLRKDTEGVLEPLPADEVSLTSEALQVPAGIRGDSSYTVFYMSRQPLDEPVAVSYAPVMKLEKGATVSVDMKVFLPDEFQLQVMAKSDYITQVAAPREQQKIDPENSPGEEWDRTNWKRDDRFWARDYEIALGFKKKAELLAGERLEGWAALRSGLDGKPMGNIQPVGQGSLLSSAPYPEKDVAAAVSGWTPELPMENRFTGGWLPVFGPHPVFRLNSTTYRVSTPGAMLATCLEGWSIEDVEVAGVKCNVVNLQEHYLDVSPKKEGDTIPTRLTFSESFLFGDVIYHWGKGNYPWDPRLLETQSGVSLRIKAVPGAGIYPIFDNEMRSNAYAYLWYGEDAPEGSTSYLEQLNISVGGASISWQEGDNLYASLKDLKGKAFAYQVRLPDSSTIRPSSSTARAEVDAPNGVPSYGSEVLGSLTLMCIVALDPQYTIKVTSDLNPEGDEYRPSQEVAGSLFESTQGEEGARTALKSQLEAAHPGSTLAERAATSTRVEVSPSFFADLVSSWDEQRKALEEVVCSDSITGSSELSLFESLKGSVDNVPQEVEHSWSLIPQDLTQEGSTDWVHQFLVQMEQSAELLYSGLYPVPAAPYEEVPGVESSGVVSYGDQLRFFLQGSGLEPYLELSGREGGLVSLRSRLFQEMRWVPEYQGEVTAYKFTASHQTELGAIVSVPCTVQVEQIPGGMRITVNARRDSHGVDETQVWEVGPLVPLELEPKGIIKPEVQLDPLLDLMPSQTFRAVSETVKVTTPADRAAGRVVRVKALPALQIEGPIGSEVEANGQVDGSLRISLFESGNATEVGFIELRPDQLIQDPGLSGWSLSGWGISYPMESLYDPSDFSSKALIYTPGLIPASDFVAYNFNGVEEPKILGSMAFDQVEFPDPSPGEVVLASWGDSGSFYSLSGKGVRGEGTLANISSLGPVAADPMTELGNTRGLYRAGCFTSIADPRYKAFMSLVLELRSDAYSSTPKGVLSTLEQDSLVEGWAEAVPGILREEGVAHLVQNAQKSIRKPEGPLSDLISAKGSLARRLEDV